MCTAVAPPFWIPAFAGMTAVVQRTPSGRGDRFALRKGRGSWSFCVSCFTAALVTFLGAFARYVGDAAATPPRASPANVASLPSRPLTLCEGDGIVSVLLTPCESPPLGGRVEFAGATLPARASPASGRFANRPYVLRTFPPHSWGNPGSLLPSGWTYRPLKGERLMLA